MEPMEKKTYKAYVLCLDWYQYEYVPLTWAELKEKVMRMAQEACLESVGAQVFEFGQPVDASAYADVPEGTRMVVVVAWARDEDELTQDFCVVAHDQYNLELVPMTKGAEWEWDVT